MKHSFLLKNGVLLASLVVNLVLTLLFWPAHQGFLPPSGPDSAQAALLSFDKTENDEVLTDTLSLAGFHIVSLSGQTVYLDDFSRVLELSPEYFSQRMIAEDPRRDGYAEKLINFFVSEGQRRLYIIPAEGQSLLVDDVSETLKNLSLPPFTLQFFRENIPLRYVSEAHTTPPWLNLIVFLLIAGLFIYFTKITPSLIMLLLGLFPLAVQGGAGLALAAILFGGGFSALGIAANYFKYRQKPAPVQCGFAIASLLAYISSIIVQGLVLPGICAFILALGFPLLLLFSNSGNKTGFRQFEPVSIRKYKSKKISPLKGEGLIAVLALLLALVATNMQGTVREASVPDNADEAAIREFAGREAARIPHFDDFIAHAEYQHNFSFRAPKRDGSVRQGYFDYSLASDGLISQSAIPVAYVQRVESDVLQTQFYPLEQLRNFLHNYTSAQEAAATEAVEVQSEAEPQKPKDSAVYQLALVLAIMAFFL
ncbi:MAG: hypothetical protein LBM77_02660 [Spirochaetaceae bacterium]|jgi:hypothetical protein|nr:hypothetical protein [Spirochaetaceae bacterium]